MTHHERKGWRLLVEAHTRIQWALEKYPLDSDALRSAISGTLMRVRRETFQEASRLRPGCSDLPTLRAAIRARAEGVR